MVRKLPAVFLTLLFLVIGNLQSLLAAPNAETYKQNAQGLEKQFEPFLKAYQHGDDKGMDEGFVLFRLPKPKEWFASYFSAEDAVRLAAAYDAEVNEGESALIEDMNLADPGSRFHVRCESRGDTGAGKPKPDEGGIQPLQTIPVEQFMLEFQSSKSGQKFRLIANFVYADGAYRFVGGGAPLWAKPSVFTGPH